MALTDDNLARLEAVELKLMDLENSVSELNEVVIRQYAEIDALKAQHQRLMTQIEQLESGSSDAASSDPAHERPPHY